MKHSLSNLTTRQLYDISISGSRPQSRPERGGEICFNSTLSTPRRPPIKKQNIRHGLGFQVAEYALANPDKTVRDVAEYFDTSTAYVRKTEKRRGFTCARVNQKVVTDMQGDG